MSRSKRAAVAADEGSALVIVLAFMTFVGLVVMATLSYAGSSFALSATSRDIAKREAAADGGGATGNRGDRATENEGARPAADEPPPRVRVLL